MEPNKTNDAKSSECLEILSTMIEKNFKENYTVLPSDPPDIIAKKTQIKMKEIKDTLDAHTKSCARGFRVLAELWCKKYED